MGDGMRLWVVADLKTDDGSVWELLGVFDSEEKANQACTTIRHGYFSVVLNEREPDESIMAQTRFPRFEEQSDA